MKLIGMPRVSTSTQVKQGDSIEAQIRRIREFCKDKEHELVTIWDDDAGKSASIKKDQYTIKLINGHLIVDYNLKNRPALLRLLESAQATSFDGVVFFKWDRLFRNPPFAKHVQEYLNQRDKIFIPTDDPEDPFASDILQIVSKYEVDKMKARVKLGRQSQFERGLIVGRCPYGYTPIYQDKAHKRGIKGIKINHKEAQIVRGIFHLKSFGASNKNISEHYGLHQQQIKNILKNKTYAGYVVFDGKEKEGLHEPLVSLEDWQKCQD